MMIPELGNLALIFALVLAVIQAVVPQLGVWRKHDGCMELSRITAVGQLFFTLFAFAALANAFLTNDFSVAYVAANSNIHLPLGYRFCAIWGAHEGSLLLWVLILSCWSALVAIFSRSLPLDILARVLSVMACIAIGFYLFLLTTSDPFVRLVSQAPLNGADLNPILQDPGLAIHPPILYMGYVGFSVAFAYAIAALQSGKFNAQWVRWIRPWTQVAWCFLTAGIVLGSWWAYRELGWGGWWFWDPVENAAFLPWLVGTALIHALAVAEKRDALKAWTILLALCVFTLSLLGTFLVRSGVLISVHTFSLDPRRGIFLLRFLMIVVSTAFLLYAWRAKRITGNSYFSFWSRENMLLMNNILLFIAMLTILLGTLYPMIINVLGFGNLSVGAPYFNAVFLPMMLPLLFLMGLGPLFQWQQVNPHENLILSIKLAVFSILVTFGFLFILHDPIHWWVLAGLFLSFWIISTTLVSRFRWVTMSNTAMTLAHVGMAVLVIGIAMSSVYSHEKKLSMQVGDHLRIGGYVFNLKKITGIRGSNYFGARADMTVKKQKRLLTVLHPALREFPDSQVAIPKTAIDAGVFRDIYVALGAALPDGSWAVRIYVKPFVRWIWAGGLLMVLGGLFALWDRRYHHEST